MSVIVCGVTVYYQRDQLPCWGLCAEFEKQCGRHEAPRRLCVIAYSWSPYYAPTIQCTVCGDRWEEGQLHERPFRRGWRQEAVQTARANLEKSRISLPKRDADGYIVSEVSA